MKVEKSISMYLHAFQQPCKHQIVTDPKSCNASHMLTISSLVVGCRNTVLSHSSLRQSEKSLCEYFMLFLVVLAIEAKDISNIKEIGYSINIIMEEHSFVKNQSLIHFHVFFNFIPIYYSDLFQNIYYNKPVYFSSLEWIASFCSSCIQCEFTQGPLY